MEWVIFAIVLGAAAYAIVIYNGLVSNRQLVKEGWSGIDVQLKRRYDLIPNLAAAMRGTFTFTDGSHGRIHDDITEARTQKKRYLTIMLWVLLKPV